MKINCALKGVHYQFNSIKEVLAKPSEVESGDILAGIAAIPSLERMAVKIVLSKLTFKGYLWKTSHTI